MAVALILLFLGAGLLIGIAAGTGKRRSTSSGGSTQKTISCPTCGSPAEVCGSTWECGWCGDFGSLR